ncbi:N-acetylmuramoyl-L-alanine amidase [Rhodovastum atsumiense]|uniref:N-acetylmuramoyl-L-alanine amidase n=1 Tax=Rhodovastum atsumiense TaxID=504468 RepID=A0A5M6IXZ2_9PROT|nr:N-acetylmuramoyl-L-alanine amidase [Rhodovastum atsumiense]KAA5613226.1 N-acetylmuramoyl-L-alanine amidase [Rhodovastum atsumiense]CAH2600619.1 N-acetylmuramoyl-L-alanine amidase [Rhodovastum atsumiense]
MTETPTGRRFVLGGLLATLGLAPIGAEAARRQTSQAQPKSGTKPVPKTKSSAKAQPKAPAAKPRPARGRQAVGSKPAAPRPAPAPLPLLVIDPGHGGHDPGAIGPSGTTEKSVTLATALELKQQLEATRRYQVRLTRSDDRFVSLADRVSFARENGATLFISIHADSSSDHRARGASVYIRSAATPAKLKRVPPRSRAIARALVGEPPSPRSAWLRTALLDSLGEEVELTNDPAREAHFHVLGASGIASVLLEMGFISNRQDEAALKRPAHRRLVARAIRDAVGDYFTQLRQPSHRT